VAKVAHFCEIIIVNESIRVSLGCELFGQREVGQMGISTKLLAAGSMAALLSFGAGIANAATYGFDCITGNSVTNCSTGESQLTMDVGDAGGGNVFFQFFNLGPLASSITQIYWEAGTPAILADLLTVVNSVGTSFAEDTGNLNLPGGNAPAIAFIEVFGANADQPVQPSGVNPGENVLVNFSLLSGKTLNDVLAQLDSGDLRVGFHVQGFSNGGSESFVNTPDGGGGGGEIPLPAAGWLILAGLGSLGALKARKRA
jgi:hypothetical protein